jgi:hypothetical protein
LGRQRVAGVPPVVATAVVSSMSDCIKKVKGKREKGKLNV